MATVLDADHEAFRESVRAFLDGEIVPRWDGWVAGGTIPDEAYRRAAEQGIGGIAAPEEYGGAGVDDARFDAVVSQECQRAGLTGYGLVLAEHTEAVRWIVRHGDEDLRARWLPALVSGEARAAFGVPRHGSTDLVDVAGGATASLLLADLGADGVAVVDLAGQGVDRRPVVGLGATGVDAADVTVDGLRAAVADPAASAALRATCRRAWSVLGMAGARATVEMTVAYVNERQVFSTPVAAFGNTRSRLAALAADLAAAESLVEQVLLDGSDAARVASALMRAVAVHDAAVDLGLQLHGGYGYMREYPVSTAFADARYLRLHARLDDLVGEVAPALGLVTVGA